MKSINCVKYLMFCGILLLLFTACDKKVEKVEKVEFTRLVQGKTSHHRNYNDSCCYIERILVKNMPKDSLEQSKIMIAYFDSAGLSIDDFLLRMPEVRDYDMSFFKDTYATRKHFMELNEYLVMNKSIPQSISGRSYNGNETYLGTIWMRRCKDTTKWKIDLSRNLGTAYSYEHNGPDLEVTKLFGDCKRAYTPKINKELAEYYSDLREKKKVFINAK